MKSGFSTWRMETRRRGLNVKICVFVVYCLFPVVADRFVHLRQYILHFSIWKIKVKNLCKKKSVLEILVSSNVEGLGLAVKRDI